MKALVLVSGLLLAPVASAQGIDGIWDFNTNDTTLGTLEFANGGTTGVFRGDGLVDQLDKIQVVAAGVGYSTRTVTFVRAGSWHQLYEGVISTNGCLMTGHLVNLNSNIPVLDRFPFWAKKRDCQ